MRPTYLPLLIGERVYMYTNMFFAFFATFCISNDKSCIFHFGDPQIKKSKNRKVQIATIFFLFFFCAKNKQIADNSMIFRKSQTKTKKTFFGAKIDQHRLKLIAFAI